MAKNNIKLNIGKYFLKILERFFPKSYLSTIYTESFFDLIVNAELSSSKDFAKIIIKNLNPQSIIDIGCGCGIYLRAFKDLGIVDVIGYDGSKNALKKSLLNNGIKLHDVRKPLKLKRRYDLCLCIEVAEHIQKKYSGLLIDNLTNLSDIILFTAATPGQGGINHINEQHPNFWINLFKEKGFEYCEQLSKKIRNEMSSKQVISWICKNLMIFKNEKS